MSAQFTSRAQGTLLLLAALVLLAPPDAQAQRYRVTVSPSAALGLNSTGQLTGSLGSFQGAFLSGPNGADPAGIGSIHCSHPSDDPSDCQFNFALGVNDAGVVVGVGQNSSAGGYAFYSGNNGVGLTRVIGTGPAATRFRAVNNAGQATGYVEEGANPFVGTRFAVLYDIAGQSYAKLTTGAGEGLALNATGAVGGGGPQAGFNGRFAFVTGDNGAGITWLPRPEGDDFMEVTGINDLGHYVGYSGVFSNGAFLPFVDFGGGISFAAIAPLAGNNNHQALAINNAGTVVGLSGGRGFVWDAVRGTRDLRTLVIPGTGADNCGQATAINQRGQILCDGNLLTPLAVASDFDGDGRSDIFWRHATTGENYLYPMDGLAILGTEGYVRTVADQNWRVAGIGDFDGDGKADVLWRNSSSGENYVYLMNGTAIAGEGYLRTVADQNWEVAGVGDFNGDGNADILWRNNASGENYLYPMNGLAILGTEGYLRSVADLNWHVAGVADLTGDGKADVVWRNAATGENYLYPMNGTAILAAEDYIRTVADQNWKIVGTGDFDGDGKSDILWRNASSGENYLYPMDGKTILGSEGYLRTVADLDWQVKGTGDYDGDGKADVLWRNAGSGENYLYFMDGTTIKPTEGYARTVADPNWRPAAALGTNGSACAVAGDCQSGHCAQSSGGGLVCASTACAGACEIADANGSCGFATAGTDPKNLCSGAYAFCSGASTSCPTSCVSDAVCSLTSYCQVFDNVCVPKLASSEPCIAHNQCQSGVCSGNECQ